MNYTILKNNNNNNNSFIFLCSGTWPHNETNKQKSRVWFGVFCLETQYIKKKSTTKKNSEWDGKNKIEEEPIRRVAQVKTNHTNRNVSRTNEPNNDETNKLNKNKNFLIATWDVYLEWQSGNYTLLYMYTIYVRDGAGPEWVDFAWFIPFCRRFILFF